MAGRRTTASALFGVGFLACASRTNPSGSAGSGSSLFVQDVLYPQPQGVGAPCTYTANPAQVSESSGTLDLDFRDDYSADLLVGNGDATPGGAAAMPAQDVVLQGLSVRVTDETGAALASFNALASGYVYSPVNGTPAYTVLGATILDSTTGEKLKSTVSPGHDAHVVASFTVFGNTRGGTPVKSDLFSFPIRVCEGCLVSFSPADMDPGLPEPNCANWQQASSALTVPCVMGQDTPVDCSQCQQIPACHGAAPDGG